jgi:hypothetical protein
VLVDIRLVKMFTQGAGHVARIGKKSNACSFLVGKPEVRRPLGRPRRRWVDSIKTDHGKIGWGGVD